MYVFEPGHINHAQIFSTAVKISTPVRKQTVIFQGVLKIILRLIVAEMIIQLAD